MAHIPTGAWPQCSDESLDFGEDGIWDVLCQQVWRAMYQNAVKKSACMYNVPRQAFSSCRCHAEILQDSNSFSFTKRAKNRMHFLGPKITFGENVKTLVNYGGTPNPSDPVKNPKKATEARHSIGLTQFSGAIKKCKKRSTICPSEDRPQRFWTFDFSECRICKTPRFLKGIRQILGHFWTFFGRFLDVFWAFLDVFWAFLDVFCGFTWSCPLFFVNSEKFPYI